MYQSSFLYRDRMCQINNLEGEKMCFISSWFQRFRLGSAGYVDFKLTAGQKIMAGT